MTLPLVVRRTTAAWRVASLCCTVTGSALVVCAISKASSRIVTTGSDPFVTSASARVDLKLNRNLILHFHRAAREADRRDTKIRVTQLGLAFESVAVTRDVDGHRPCPAMQLELAPNGKAITGEWHHGCRAKSNLRETRRVDDIWSHHSRPHLVAIFLRKPWVEHAHALHIYGEGDVRRRRVVDRPFFHECLNDVVI